MPVREPGAGHCLSGGSRRRRGSLRAPGGPSPRLSGPGGLQQRTQAIQGLLDVVRTVAFRDIVGVYSQLHHAAAVEVLGHDFEQGTGVDTLPAVLADGDGQPGFMDSPNKKRRRPCMQSDVGLNDCVLYWQRDSLVSDSGDGGAGGDPVNLSLAGPRSRANQNGPVV